MTRFKLETREQWLTEAASLLIARYTRGNADAERFFRRAIRWSCSAPKSRRARVMSEMYHPDESDSERFEVFVRAEVSNEISVLREVAINVHRIACTTTGSRYTSRNALAQAWDVFVTPGARRNWSDWGFDIARASAWWSEVGMDALGDYPHDQISCEAMDKRRQKTRALKLLCRGCGFIARCSWSALQTAGNTPQCGCGRRMDIVDKAGDDLMLDGVAAVNILRAASLQRLNDQMQGQQPSNAVQQVEARSTDVRVGQLLESAQNVNSEVGNSLSARQRAREARWTKRGEELKSFPKMWNGDTPVRMRAQTWIMLSGKRKNKYVRQGTVDVTLKQLEDLSVFRSATWHYLGEYSCNPTFRVIPKKKSLHGAVFYLTGSVTLCFDHADPYTYHAESGHNRPITAARVIRDIALSKKTDATTFIGFACNLHIGSEKNAISSRWAKVLQDADDVEQLEKAGLPVKERKFKVSKRFQKLEILEPVVVTPIKSKPSKRTAKLELD